MGFQVNQGSDTTLQRDMWVLCVFFAAGRMVHLMGGRLRQMAACLQLRQLACCRSFTLQATHKVSLLACAATASIQCHKTRHLLPVAPAAAAAAGTGPADGWHFAGASALLHPFKHVGACRRPPPSHTQTCTPHSCCALHLYRSTKTSQTCFGPPAMGSE